MLLVWGLNEQEMSDKMNRERHRRRWRAYRTEGGASPVRDFIISLDERDARAILAEMEIVRRRGLTAARHLHGDIYEVRAESETHSFRVLFATEGRFSQVLLALEAFQKTTRRTPPALITLAERRLADWRQRGKVRKR